ncbi:MAG: alpha-2-macroglobulin family protein, partial [Myxococcaceae bacterium]
MSAALGNSFDQSKTSDGGTRVDGPVSSGLAQQIAALTDVDAGVSLFSIGPTVAAPHEEPIAGKVVSWTRVMGQPRLVTSLTHGDEAGPAGVLLVFDQEVNPTLLARAIGVWTRDGERPKFRVTQPTTVWPLYDGPLDLSYVIQVTPRSTLSHGESFGIDVPTWEDGRLSSQQMRFRTNRELSVTASAVLDRAPLSFHYALNVSNPLAEPLTETDVRIEPRPSELSVQQWDGYLGLTMTLAPGTQYRLTLPTLIDIFGNRATPARIKFTADDLPTELQAPAFPVVLERRVARLPLRTLNTGIVTAEVHPSSCETEPVGKQLHIQPRAKLNERAVVDVPLQGLHGRYCISLHAEGVGSKHSAVQAKAEVQVSDLSATVKLFPGGVFVWSTHLSDSTPVPNARIEALDGVGNVIAKGRSDADGVVKLSLRGEAKQITVRSGDDFARVELDEDHVSRAWQFGFPEAREEAPVLPAAVFSDRGVYRPGETAHVKVVLPSGSAATAQVTDPKGQRVLEQKLRADRVGGAAFDMKLAEKATVGPYSVQVTQAGRSTSYSFRVEEYRVPTFEVKVEAPAQWTLGTEIAATLNGRYFHGGPMAGRAVKWSLYREGETFSPSGFNGFIFGAQQHRPAQLIDSGEGKLDGNGTLTVRFTPNTDALSRYTLEANVTDVDRQSYAGRTSRRVHPAPYYVGIRPPSRQVLAMGTALEVPLVVVTPEGTPKKDAAIQVELQRLDYHSTARLVGTQGVELSSQPVQAVVARCTSATSCKLILDQAGAFRVRASSGSAVTDVGLTVAGDNGAAWPRFEHARIDVVADKPLYQVGDVAELVVQTPFARAKGLLTLESNGVLRHQFFEISGNTPALKVPITAELGPNTFASVVLLRGRVHDEKDATGFETGAPSFKVGYVELKVDAAERRLAVEVLPSAKVLAPRGELDVQVRVKDRFGKPVSGVATVAIVDEAVLGLTGFKTPELLSKLYARQPLAVRTADGRLDLVHSRRERREALFPGGDGGDGLALRILPGDLRNLFQSTAYWN